MPVARERRFALILTALFAVWVVFVAVHHECWRDEADAWLAARDMTPPELFRWLGGAGTPGLWYLLVMPLAKCGAPYVSMSLLHAALAVCVAAVIAFRAPFSRPFKVLLLFSYPLSYEYAVVARSYVLTVLLLFLIAVVLKGERRRPVLVGGLLLLLFNANAHGFFIAAVISIAVAIDTVRRREISPGFWIGGLIALAGGVAAFLQLLPPRGAHRPTSSPQWVVVGDAFSQLFFPHVPAYTGFFLRHSHGMTWLAEAGYLGIRWFGALLLLSLLFRMRRSPIALAVVSFSMAAMFYVFVFHWYGGERHAGLLLALVVFGMWLTNPQNKTPSPPLHRTPSSIVFAITLAYSCATALVWSFQDIRWEYSGGKSAAAFIRDKSLTDLPIAAIPGPDAESILPYLPDTRFWYVARQEYGSYVRWDRDWQIDYNLPQAEILSRVGRQFGQADHLLLIAPKPLVDPSGYVLIYRRSRRIFDANARDEDYFIYAPLGTPAARLGFGKN